MAAGAAQGVRGVTFATFPPTRHGVRGTAAMRGGGAKNPRVQDFCMQLRIHSSVQSGCAPLPGCPARQDKEKRLQHWNFNGLRWLEA